MSTISRYPGSRSFQDTDIDRLLFYGREAEKAALLHLVLAQDLILFYAKSGTGKTSLLNAGVLKPLRDKSYFPIMLRLNDPSRDSTQVVLEQVHVAATAQKVEVDHVDSAPRDLASIFTALRFWRGDILLTPVLIFDQFEELFTITPQAQREAFIDEFARLARGERERDENDESRSNTIAGPSPKIILSLREDYLGELEVVAAAVPRIMAHRFRLTALTREQAEDAIVRPAMSKDGRIPGAIFTFEKGAIGEMLDFLCAQRVSRSVITREVEPFQLQILCQHVEATVRDRLTAVDGAAVVRRSDLGGREGMEAILQGFYSQRMGEFDEAERDALRRLCERGLISETGKRLSLEEEQIERQFGVRKELLVRLIEQRLLRADPRTGSTYYELSHDTLVGPILRDRDERDPDAVLKSADSRRISGAYADAMQLYERAVTLQPLNVVANVQWATMLVQLGRFDDAANVLNAAIKRGVKHESVHHTFGKVFAAKGNQKAAIEQYMDALKLNDGLSVVHADLATAYRDDKQTDNAVKAYERSIELDPQNAETRRSLALLLIALRQFERAVVVFRDAVTVNPQSGYIFKELTTELLANNQKDLARTVCVIASELESHDSGFFRELGNQLMTIQDYDRAVSAFAKSASLAPDDPWTYLGWGLTLITMGRTDEANEKIQKAMGLDPINVLSFGAELQIDSDPSQAAALYERAAAFDSSNSATFHNWGRALIKSGRLDEAETAFLRSLEINPTNAGALNGLALVAQYRGNIADAETLFRQAIQHGAADPLYQRNLGDLLREYTNRWAEAAAAYNKALEIDPKYGDAFNGLALGEQARGRFADAELLYRRAMEVAPTQPIYPRNLGNMLREARRLDEAEAAHRQALAIDPNYSDALNGLALVEQDRGHLAQAEMWFRRAMEAVPRRSLYPRNLGDLLRERTNRWDEAEAAYKIALDIDPADSAALNGLALLEQARRHIPEAEALFRQAMEASPAERLFPRNLGDLLREMTPRVEDAEAAYMRALALDSRYADAFNGLGLLEDARGRTAEAEEFFLKAMEAEPLQALYPRNLGDLLRAKTNRWDEAEAAYNKALELDPQFVDAVNGLGLLAKARGRIEEAERFFRTAVTLAPAELVYTANLADLLNTSGRADDAETVLRKFIEANPTSADAYNALAWALRNSNERLREAWELANKAAELQPAPEILHTFADVSVSLDHPQWMNAVAAWLAAPSLGFPTQFRLDTISTLRKVLQRGHAPQLLSVMHRLPADSVWAPWTQAVEAVLDPVKIGTLSDEARDVHRELASEAPLTGG